MTSPARFAPLPDDDLLALDEALWAMMGTAAGPLQTAHINLGNAQWLRSTLAMQLARQQLFCATLWAALTSAGAATLEYDIQAYVDGRDLLCISADSLQWHHLDYAAVGRWGGGNAPTIISCWSNSVMTMSNVNWYPTWPSPPPAEIRNEAFSSSFTGLAPALPAREVNLNVDLIQVRSVFAINQLPSSTNNYTLILDFNDDATGNPTIGYAAWYHVHLTVTPRIVAPRFTAIAQSEGGLRLSWEAVSGQSYQLQCITDLSATNWAPLQTITATNIIGSALDLSPANTRRFYRLLAQ